MVNYSVRLNSNKYYVRTFLNLTIRPSNSLTRTPRNLNFESSSLKKTELLTLMNNYST